MLFEEASGGVNLMSQSYGLRRVEKWLPGEAECRDQTKRARVLLHHAGRGGEERKEEQVHWEAGLGRLEEKLTWSRGNRRV